MKTARHRFAFGRAPGKGHPAAGPLPGGPAGGAVVLGAVVLGAMVLALAVGCTSVETKTEETRYIPEEPGEVNLSLYREADENRLFIELNNLMTRWNRAALEYDPVVRAGIRDQVERYVRVNFELIRDALDSDNPRFRIVALATIGFSERPDVVPVLLAVLADADPLVVSNALLSLAELSPFGQRLEPVVALLDHPEASVRSNALRVIARNVGPSDRERLGDEVFARLTDEDGWVRVHAIAAAEALGGREAVLAISRTAGDSFKVVRVRAARALGGLDDRVAGRVLLRMLEDPEGDVRETAAAALRVLYDRTDLGPSPTAWRPVVESGEDAAEG